MIFAFVSLILGLLCGYFLFPPEAIPAIDQVMTWALRLLLLTIGIETGANKAVFYKLREYGVRILVVPIGVLVGSLAAGWIAGLFLGAAPNESLSISAGMGFYSVSAGILRELGGTLIGTTAFLTNMMRELLSFLVVPFVARWFGPYAAVAPSGATAMDTTLPVIVRSTSKDMALIAIVSGAVLTAVVPLIVPLLFNLNL